MVDLLRSDFMGFAKEQFGHDDSHSLIRLDPVPKNFQYISTESQLSIMTPYLGRLLGMKAAVRSTIEAKAMYDMLLDSPQMRSAMGWVFEGRVHWFLHQGGIILFGHQLDEDQKLALEMKPGNATFSTMQDLSNIPLFADVLGRHGSMIQRHFKSQSESI
jgi:hypothetical protein